MPDFNFYYRKGSKYLWFDFGTGAGRVRRCSTKQTTEAKAKTAANLIYKKAMEESGDDPLVPKRKPTLEQYAKTFGEWAENNLEFRPKTRRYYKDGVRLLLASKLRNVTLDKIDKDRVATTVFVG